MGSTDSKKIHEQIDNQFKSIRRYYDTFYGQITVIEHKKSKTQYALVEKIILSPQINLTSYLQQRQQQSQYYLIDLFQKYYCDIDLCSGGQHHFFILQYCNHSLYNQIVVRQQGKNYFQRTQLLHIFSIYIDIVIFLRVTYPKFIINNTQVIYKNEKKLKVIQPLLRNEPQILQNTNANNFQMKNIYQSPESYRYLCRKQYIKARQLSYTENSFVFTLGVNFLQCILLGDISCIYNERNKEVDFNKIKDLLKEIYPQYGDTIYQLISQMLNEKSNLRPFLHEIQSYLQQNLKKRKISVPNLVNSTTARY